MADKKVLGEKEKGLNFMQRLLQNDNARKIIVVVGVVAILVIFLSSFFGGNKKQTTNTETVQQTSASAQSVDDFKTQTEQSLTNLINGIEGVGKCQCVGHHRKKVQNKCMQLKKKTSTQTQQDKNTSSTTKNQSNNSNETKYLVIKNSDGTQQPIAVTEVQPIVKGVVVVCDGGDNPLIQQKVIQAVTTALDITSTRVCVIQSK